MLPVSSVMGPIYLQEPWWMQRDFLTLGLE